MLKQFHKSLFNVNIIFSNLSHIYIDFVSFFSLQKKTFPKGQLYVVLILKPTNADCIECCEATSGMKGFNLSVFMFLVAVIYNASKNQFFNFSSTSVLQISNS